MQSTRKAPNRSAIAPAKGWPTPQSRFWIAMAKPKVSRPQPYSVIIGSWNRPDEARGPKVIRAIRQPARTMISGETRVRTGDADMVSALQGQAGARRLAQVAASAELKVCRLWYEVLLWVAEREGRHPRCRPSVRFGQPVRSDDGKVVVLEGEVLLQHGELDRLALARAIGVVGQHARLLVVDQVIVLVRGLGADLEEGRLERGGVLLRALASELLEDAVVEPDRVVSYTRSR